MTVDDTPAVGIVHVRAWQAAYAGVMPDEYLDGLCAEDRADMWRRIIDQPPPNGHHVVIEAAGEIVGFAAHGEERGTVDDPAVGELIAINIDPAHWSHGYGRTLLRHVTAELTAFGYRRAILWVVTENDRARRFYETAGWSFDGTERVDTVQGATVNEVRYSRSLIG
jgi:GNAT superfamily N-acetyltransferase